MKVCVMCGKSKKLVQFKLIWTTKRQRERGDRHDKCKICHEEWFKNLLISSRGQEAWDEYILSIFKDRVRSRTRSAFRRIKENKPAKTVELLGADWMLVKEYIESKFKDGLSWDNFSEWHIDHIKPLSLGNNTEEIMVLCHYTNLQPLWAKDNLRKSNSYNGKPPFKNKKM